MTVFGWYLIAVLIVTLCTNLVSLTKRETNDNQSAISIARYFMFAFIVLNIVGIFVFGTGSLN